MFAPAAALQSVKIKIKVAGSKNIFALILLPPYNYIFTIEIMKNLLYIF